MAIAHDTTVTTNTFTTTATFNHAAAAGARSAVVLIHQSGSTDEITTVTYGGATMNDLGSNSETTEAGRVYIFFLDGVAGGTQEVVITSTGSTAKRYVVTTQTVGTNMAVAVAGDGYATGTSASTSNPTWNITGLTASEQVLAYEVIHSGLQSMTTTPQASPAWTRIATSPYDLGAIGNGFAYILNTPSGTTLACGWAAATGDDFVGASVALKEVTASTTHPFAGTIAATGATALTDGGVEIMPFAGTAAATGATVGNLTQPLPRLLSETVVDSNTGYTNYDTTITVDAECDFLLIHHIYPAAVAEAGVTFDGAAMTLIDESHSAGAGTGRGVASYYKVAPATGTGKTLTLSMASSYNQGAIIQQWKNIDQTAPVVSGSVVKSNGNTGTSTSASTGSNFPFVGVIGHRGTIAASPLTWGGDQSTSYGRYALLGGTNQQFVATTQSAGSTMSFGWTTADYWAYIGFALAPVASKQVLAGTIAATSGAALTTGITTAAFVGAAAASAATALTATQQHQIAGTAAASSATTGAMALIERQASTGAAAAVSTTVLTTGIMLAAMSGTAAAVSATALTAGIVLATMSGTAAADSATTGALVRIDRQASTGTSAPSSAASLTLTGSLWTYALVGTSAATSTTFADVTVTVPGWAGTSAAVSAALSSAERWILNLSGQSPGTSATSGTWYMLVPAWAGTAAAVSGMGGGGGATTPSPKASANYSAATVTKAQVEALGAVAGDLVLVQTYVFVQGVFEEDDWYWDVPSLTSYPAGLTTLLSSGLGAGAGDANVMGVGEVPYDSGITSYGFTADITLGTEGAVRSSVMVISGADLATPIDAGSSVLGSTGTTTDADAELVVTGLSGSFSAGTTAITTGGWTTDAGAVASNRAAALGHKVQTSAGATGSVAWSNVTGGQQWFTALVTTSGGGGTEMKVIATMAGTAPASSASSLTLTGSVWTLALSGVSAAVSTASADLTILVPGWTGTAAASAATLSSAERWILDLSGQSPGTSTTTGDLVRVVPGWSGSTDAVSAVSGVLENQSTTQPFAGTIESVSDAQGALTLQAVLSGTADATSTAELTGGLIRYGFAGTAPATSTATAAWTMTVVLAGTTDAVSGTSGALTRIVPDWAGACDATAATSGTWTMRAVLAGSFDAVSGSSGAMVLLGKDWAGTVAAVSDVPSPDMSVIGQVTTWTFAGTVPASGDTSLTLTGSVWTLRLEGTAPAVSAASSAVLTALVRGWAGTAPAVSSASLTAALRASLAGFTAASSTTALTLAQQHVLAATAAAVSDADAAMTLLAVLAGRTDAVSATQAAWLDNLVYGWGLPRIGA